MRNPDEDSAEALANAALSCWPLPANASPKLINSAENLTFLITAGDTRHVLRLHREGYHSKRAIECELLWSAALDADGGVPAPRARAGRNGELVQNSAGRLFTLFDHIEGEHPREDQDLAPAFASLGEVAARTHIHSLGWRRPEPFERLRWDVAAVLGPQPIWGDWRAAPNVGPDEAEVIGRASERVSDRLEKYGRGPDRFGLIHADMRLANILIHQGRPRLIDFDDCGIGWLMYDFAAAVSFIEDDPELPELKQAWLRGYRRLRTASAEDEAAIDSLIMLRRIALLGWIGSRIEATEPQALAPHFAAGTAALAEAYLTAG